MGVVLTTPSALSENRVANKITLTADGINNISSSDICTWPPKKIINVVTSPVIKATPPEFTAKIINTAILRRICLSSLKVVNKPNDTNVAVTLSQNAESTSANRATWIINMRTDTFCGNSFCTMIWIMPLAFKYATKVMVDIRKSQSVAISSKFSLS